VVIKLRLADGPGELGELFLRCRQETPVAWSDRSRIRYPE
jgi:hypothetical protein